MACVQREYQFTLPYFYKLFDEAIGGEFPPEYYEETDDPEVSSSEVSSQFINTVFAPSCTCEITFTFNQKLIRGQLRHMC